MTTIYPAPAGRAFLIAGLGCVVFLGMCYAATRDPADTPAAPSAGSPERAADSSAFAALAGRTATATRAELVRFDYLAHRWGFQRGHDSAAHARATSAILDSAQALLRSRPPQPSLAGVLLQSTWLPMTPEQTARRERLSRQVEAARPAEREREERDAQNAAADAVIAGAPCRPSRAKVRRSMERHPEWDVAVIGAVVCGRVQIGMTREQAIAGWGRPRDINRTTGSFGVHEQWVYGEYGSSYLYFEDGVLTAVQN